jgi:hypothetical protein
MSLGFVCDFDLYFHQDLTKLLLPAMQPPRHCRVGKLTLPYPRMYSTLWELLWAVHTALKLHVDCGAGDEAPRDRMPDPVWLGWPDTT